MSILQEMSAGIRNSRLKRMINKIADKVITKKPIESQDLNILLKRINGVTSSLIRKEETYEAIKNFCGGIASAFTRIDEISINFEEETKVHISNIKVMTSFIINPKHTEKKVIAEYGDMITTKANLINALNGLAAAIKNEEISKVKTAVAA